jgi:hypothetical protein
VPFWSTGDDVRLVRHLAMPFERSQRLAALRVPALDHLSVINCSTRSVREVRPLRQRDSSTTRVTARSEDRQTVRRLITKVGRRPRERRAPGQRQPNPERHGADMMSSGIGSRMPPCVAQADGPSIIGFPQTVGAGHATYCHDRPRDL